MSRCANTEALNRYEAQQESGEVNYENMLDVLRDAEPEDYSCIMDEYGFGDIDFSEVEMDI